MGWREFLGIGKHPPEPEPESKLYFANGTDSENYIKQMQEYKWTLQQQLAQPVSGYFTDDTIGAVDSSMLQQPWALTTASTTSTTASTTSATLTQENLVEAARLMGAMVPKGSSTKRTSISPPPPLREKSILEKASEEVEKELG